MILLFDIDGTLLTCGGAGRRALERAFQDVLGAAEALRGVRLAGSTDRQIIEDGLRSAQVGLETTETHGEALLERYLECLEDELHRPGSGFEVLPGAAALLDALAGDPRFVIGLATGNVERGAYLKLARGGLDQYFDFGGFGSDAQRRAELVAKGVSRGLARASERGLRLGLEHVLVLGDTGLDVEAARSAGVRAVGVLAGSHHHEELRAAGPAYLTDHLHDPSFWRWLGLSAADPQGSKT